MKSRLLVWLGMLACVLVPMAHAVEIMHWERLPLAVPLQVGEERIVFVDRNVRVGVPARCAETTRKLATEHWLTRLNRAQAARVGGLNLDRLGFG